MSGLKQPAAGIAATALVMVVALAFVSLFSFAVFTGWVSYFLLCAIPMQIVVAVTWGSKPGFAARHEQPARGAILLAVNLAVGLAVTLVTFATIGGRISPPTPMLTMCAIVSVVVMFWAAVMWGGWPFTAWIRNPVAAGFVMLGAVYVVNVALFRVFFDYGFMQGAPVYVPAQDPHGLFPAWHALVFYLSCLAGMFVMLHFDLWPLSKHPSLRAQPRLGAAWTAGAIGLGALLFSAGVVVGGADPVAFMVRVPVPFIFGTIVVQNMLEGSLFAGAAQPLKGMLNVAAAIACGELLSIVYGALAPVVTGDLRAGPPGYEFEIWLASALLSVTFPLLIFQAEFFDFWPLRRQARPAPMPAATTDGR